MAIALYSNLLPNLYTRKIHELNCDIMETFSKELCTEQLDAAIGMELECQRKCKNAVMMKLFCVLNFCHSMLNLFAYRALRSRPDVCILCTYACQLILPINSVSQPCQDVDLFVVSIVFVYTFPKLSPKISQCQFVCLYLVYLSY